MTATTTFDWKIVQLDRDAETGTVVQAHWRCDATDGTHSAGAYGSASFTRDESAEGFIPFDQLTEADVLGWIFAQDGFDKDATEAALQSQIDQQANPPVVSGLPW